MSLKVIKFGAIWCGPCRTLQPIWDEIIDDNPGVEFESVDVDKEPKLAKKHSVSAVPTILFIKDGTTVDVTIGLHNKLFLQAKINKFK